jgi:peptidoglycan/LPS O-acetylase OafA/YrhL
VFGGWSIAVEAMFYLFFPLLFKLLKSIPVTLFFTLITMLIMQMLRIYLLGQPFASNADVQTYSFQFFPSQLPVFLIGMSVFALMSKNRFNVVDKKYIKIIGGVFTVLMSLQLLFHKIIAGLYLCAPLCYSIIWLIKIPCTTSS